METILIILAVLAVGAGVYYFGFYKKGKINDRDGDFIPDEIEDDIRRCKRSCKNCEEKELKE